MEVQEALRALSDKLRQVLAAVNYQVAPDTLAPFRVRLQRCSAAPHRCPAPECRCCAWALHASPGPAHAGQAHACSAAWLACRALHPLCTPAAFLQDLPDH